MCNAKPLPYPKIKPHIIRIPLQMGEVRILGDMGTQTAKQPSRPQGGRSPVREFFGCLGRAINTCVIHTIP